MKTPTKTTALIALVSAFLGAAGGFFVHRAWFTEDKAFLAASKAQAEQLDALDAALDAPQD